jgi:acyl-coenzyme A thioesterase PaaI-like protein
LAEENRITGNGENKENSCQIHRDLAGVLCFLRSIFMDELKIILDKRREFMKIELVRHSKSLFPSPCPCVSFGITHGGVVAALVDMAAGVALRTLKLRILTVEFATSYFQPVSLEADLVAEARLVQAGYT